VRCCLVVFLAAGCNTLMGLEPTTLGTMGNPNPTCPAMGAAPPTFASSLIEILPRRCFSYTFSADVDLAVALCADNNVLAIEEGPIDGALTPSTIALTIGENFQTPSLAPEGDLLIVRQFGGGANRFSAYRRAGTGWAWHRDVIDVPDDFLVTVGVPSRGPSRRILVGGEAGLRELVEDPDGWRVHAETPWAALGVTFGAHPNLSEDGTRMTFLASSPSPARMMYADRASLDEPFGAAREIPSLPEVTVGGFLTDDCGRFYFGGLSSVFYAYQQ